MLLETYNIRTVPVLLPGSETLIDRKNITYDTNITTERTKRVKETIDLRFHIFCGLRLDLE